MTMTKQQARIASLEREIERLLARIQADVELRPMWARGFSSDSIAAQTACGALHSIWKELGVSNQTECMEKLRRLRQTGALPA